MWTWVAGRGGGGGWRRARVMGAEFVEWLGARGLQDFRLVGEGHPREFEKRLKKNILSTTS
eukprot:5985189-Pyramimonas_sp.AAC.1